MMKIFMKAFLASLMVLMPCSIQAQESNGFKKIDVKEDFTENGFTWFHDAELLAAGIHSMYIGEVVNAWKK